MTTFCECTKVRPLFVFCILVTNYDYKQCGKRVWKISLPTRCIYANNDLFPTAVEVQLSISKAMIHVKHLAGPRWRSEGAEYPGTRILNLCMNAILLYRRQFGGEVHHDCQCHQRNSCFTPVDASCAFTQTYPIHFLFVRTIEGYCSVRVPLTQVLSACLCLLNFLWANVNSRFSCIHIFKSQY